MKKIEAYQTEDGCVFTDINVANRHEQDKKSREKLEDLFEEYLHDHAISDFIDEIVGLRTEFIAALLGVDEAYLMNSIDIALEEGGEKPHEFLTEIKRRLK